MTISIEERLIYNNFSMKLYASYKSCSVNARL